MPGIGKIAGSRWTAVHTRPRCEKTLAAYCCRHGIACYLPLRRRAKRYQRRTVETFLPMFPGYLFACVNAALATVLLQSNRVASILPVDDARETRLIAELGEIQALEAAELEAELMVQPELVAGRPVCITAGPLRGVTGIVQRRRQKLRVTVNVEMLGQSVAVELDLGEIQLAKDS